MNLKRLTCLGLILFAGHCLAETALVYADSETKPDSSPSQEQGMQHSEIGPYLNQGLDRDSLKNAAVRAAMSRVPRHRFVPEEQQASAYEDRALAIGLGQTISQPYVVALMTERTGVTKGSKVLEIGTGSGYQAAVLAEMGATVFSIEILPELAERAKAVLHSLGYGSQVHVRTGDGWQGWPEEGPFDAILVTASSPRIPEKLLSQLANRGRMILPLEKPGKNERMLVIERDGDNISTRDIGAFKFVSLTGNVREEDIMENNPLEKSATEAALGIGSTPTITRPPLSR